jgi:hypothetical protein
MEIWGWRWWKRGPRNRVEMCIYRGRKRWKKEREKLVVNTPIFYRVVWQEERGRWKWCCN